MPNSTHLQFIRQLRHEGYLIENTRGGHLRITHPEMPRHVICSKTPSDNRSMLNTKTRLKRYRTETQ